MLESLGLAALWGEEESRLATLGVERGTGHEEERSPSLPPMSQDYSQVVTRIQQRTQAILPRVGVRPGRKRLGAGGGTVVRAKAREPASQPNGPLVGGEEPGPSVEEPGSQEVGSGGQAGEEFQANEEKERRNKRVLTETSLNLSGAAESTKKKLAAFKSPEPTSKDEIQECESKTIKQPESNTTRSTQSASKRSKNDMLSFISKLKTSDNQKSYKFDIGASASVQSGFEDDDLDDFDLDI